MEQENVIDEIYYSKFNPMPLDAETTFIAPKDYVQNDRVVAAAGDEGEIIGYLPAPEETEADVIYLIYFPKTEMLLEIEDVLERLQDLE